jgi:shikimate dehydrogenase
MEEHPNSEKSKNEKNFYILGDARVLNTKAPAIFSSIMKKAGIKGSYEPFVITPGKLGDAVKEIRLMNVAGANVTIPYKESIIPYLDDLSEGATIIGSINTIVTTGNKLKGYNTNAIGFMDALKDADMDIAGKSVLVFGTGGAARAVVFILNWVRANPILITGRNQGKINAITKQIGGEAISLKALPDRPLAIDLLVNATSVSSPGESPELAALVQQLQLPNCEMVIDLNYGRSRNFWQEMAQSKGIPFMDGLSSLANQAKRTFSLWTGIDIKHEDVLSAIQDASAVALYPILPST